jgi:sulfur-oxidizing protein SoxX
LKLRRNKPGSDHGFRFLGVAMLVFLGAACGPARAGPLVAYRVTAGGIEAPLTAEPGDPARGRDVVLNRNQGACLLCHALPADPADPRTRVMGDIGPPLAGVGARLGPAQLRLRLVDAMVLNPQTVMPSYYRVDGLSRVAPAFQGKPVLSAQQIEDAVAFLLTLKHTDEDAKR